MTRSPLSLHVIPPVAPAPFRRWMTGLALAACTLTVQAHGDGQHNAHAQHAAAASGPAVQTDWGIAGRPGQVNRTVRLRLDDRMRFTPDRFEVREGETLRIEVHNTGKVMHEFVLGTAEEHKAHAAAMAANPTMEHSAAHMVHVAPGKKGSLVWTFNRSGEFDFACLVAGHFEAGMVGKVKVKPASSAPLPAKAPAAASGAPSGHGAHSH